MSNAATAQAMRVPAEAASGAVRLVMFVLADSASSDTGHSFMGVERIAEFAGVSVRSAQRALRALEALGVIETSLNRGGLADWDEHRRPNLYRWCYNVAESLRQGAGRGDAGVTTPVTPVSPGDASVTPVAEWGDTRVTGPGDTRVTGPGDTRVTTPVTPVSPNPSIEPPSKNLGESPSVVGSFLVAQRAEARPTATQDALDTSTGTEAPPVLEPAPAPPAPAKPPKAPRERRRGTRLPEDFAVTPAMAAWAAQHTPGVDHEAETARFRDYWAGVPGQRGTKLDWEATWRNWMRKAADDAAARHGYGRHQPPPQGRRLDLPTDDETWDRVTQELFTATAYRDVIGSQP